VNPYWELINKYYRNLLPQPCWLDLPRGQNGHLPLSGNWDYELKFSRKFYARSSIPINWFISCNNSLLFAGTTLTRHKSQNHCSGVMQCWACSSLMSTPLPAGIGEDKGGPRDHVPKKFLKHIVICAERVICAYTSY